MRRRVAACLATIALSCACLGGAQAINAKPRASGHEPGFGGLDVFPGSPPAQIKVLDCVFRVADRSQHAIGKFEQAAAGGFESACRLLGVGRHGGLGRCTLQAIA